MSIIFPAFIPSSDSHSAVLFRVTLSLLNRGPSKHQMGHYEDYLMNKVTQIDFNLDYEWAEKAE